jgi:hypothetical protein
MDVPHLVLTKQRTDSFFLYSSEVYLLSVYGLE